MTFLKIVWRFMLFVTGIYLLGLGLLCGVVGIASPLQLWFAALIGLGAGFAGVFLMKAAFRKSEDSPAREE